MNKRNKKEIKIEVRGGISGQVLTVKSKTKTHFLAADSTGFIFTVHKNRAVVKS